MPRWFMRPQSTLAKLLSVVLLITRKLCNHEMLLLHQGGRLAACWVNFWGFNRERSAKKLATGERMDFIQSPLPSCPSAKGFDAGVNLDIMSLSLMDHGFMALLMLPKLLKSISLCDSKESVTKRMKQSESTVTEPTNTPRALFSCCVWHSLGMVHGIISNYPKSISRMWSVNTAANVHDKEPSRADWHISN